jgi:hypothetical protein
MDDRSEKPPAATGADQRAGRGNLVEKAFDIWLQRHLHRLYDDAMREPLSPELLRLIEADRNKGKS